MRISEDCKFKSTEGKMIRNYCRRMQKEKQTSKKNQEQLQLSSNREETILHEDISNLTIIPSPYFPIQWMIFPCPPAHHFSAINKSNLHYGCCTNMNITYCLLVFLHTSYSSVQEYYRLLFKHPHTFNITMSGLS